MTRWLASFLAAALLALSAGCPPVPPRTRPNYQKVRQDHKKAQQQLRQEEDRQQEED